MDLFNIPKIIEQGVYDVMMWILFFPRTLVRMIVWPRSTLAYVRTEAALDRENAFSEAMQPTLFLLIALIISSAISPDDPEGLKLVTGSELGKLIFGSWANTIGFSMIISCLIPLTGALLLDLLTPGKVSRETMRIPFEQQCYIGAPSTLMLFSTMAWGPALGATLAAILGAAIILWVVAAEYFFFRDGGPTTPIKALGLALATLLIGLILITICVVLLMLASTSGTAALKGTA